MIWPFCPLNPMIEGLQFTTDRIRSFSADQRIRLTDIPRRTFNHEYRWTALEYEKARAMMRGRMPSTFSVPDWSVLRRVTVSNGATSISFDNTAPQLTDADAVAIIQDSDTYEEIFIDTASDGGVTLLSSVNGNYVNAAIVPLLTCHAAEGLPASRSLQPIREAQIEWRAYEGTDISDDGGRQTHRSRPVLTECSQLGDSAFDASLYFPYDMVDNGLAVPFLDTLQEQPVQRFGAAWQPVGRQNVYALRQFFHYIKGRQRAFWVPDQNNALQLASSIGLGATTISIRNVGFTDGYGVGDLFLRKTNGTVYTYQVTGSVEAGANETLTLSTPTGAAVSAADVDELCLMFCVILSADRIEFLHRGPDLPARVVVEVEEVPA